MTIPFRPAPPPSRLQRLLAQSLGVPVAEAADATRVTSRQQAMEQAVMQADAGFGESLGDYNRRRAVETLGMLPIVGTGLRMAQSARQGDLRGALVAGTVGAGEQFLDAATGGVGDDVARGARAVSAVSGAERAAISDWSALLRSRIDEIERAASAEWGPIARQRPSYQRDLAVKEVRRRGLDAFQSLRSEFLAPPSGVEGVVYVRKPLDVYSLEAGVVANGQPLLVTGRIGLDGVVRDVSVRSAGVENEFLDRGYNTGLSNALGPKKVLRMQRELADSIQSRLGKKIVGFEGLRVRGSKARLDDDERRTAFIPVKRAP